ISVGCGLPRADFDACVHSVFQSAANLRLARGSRLLTLLASSQADLPQGIRLNTPQGFSFERLSLGEQATSRDGLLRFENSSLTIELRGASRWKCDLPSLNADMMDPAVAAAWESVWQALNKRQALPDSDRVGVALSLSKGAAQSLVGDLFRPDAALQMGASRKAGEALRKLVDITRRLDLSATSTVGALIGLGPGLTPGGDDLLVGYLAGLWCTVRDRSERARFISALGKTVIRLSRQTNDISRTYLYHAARGQVSSRLTALAEAICRGDHADRLLEAAEAAMRVGHTSGMEAVAGLLVGLTVWNNPKTPPPLADRSARLPQP
ncbi:MAG: hypothetical protein C0393_04700, partial [Anaerolinea sp.]|nr:hypothetical protein [Anaerolinea sp.]